MFTNSGSVSAYIGVGGLGLEPIMLTAKKTFFSEDFWFSFPAFLQQLEAHLF
jgi:hypothetical protein